VGSGVTVAPVGHASDYSACAEFHALVARGGAQGCG